jgi:hypothetical protein
MTSGSPTEPRCRISIFPSGSGRALGGGVCPHLRLDPLDDRLGLVLAPVDHEPSGTLRDLAPDVQDAEAKQGAHGKPESPAYVGREQALIEQHECQGARE